MKYNQLILNSLIDKYERSKVSKGTNKSAVRISVLTNKLSKEYFLSNHYDVFNDFNQCFSFLEMHHFVSLESDSQYIVKATLNLDKVNEVYSFLKRKPSIDKTKDRINLLLEYEKYSDLSAVTNYLLDLEMAGKSTLKYYSNEEQLIKILKGTLYLLINDEEHSLRITSQIIYADSKELEKNLSKIRLLIRDVFDFSDDQGEQQFFERFGIIKNPQYIYIKGLLNFNLASNDIELSLIKGGLAIGSDSLDSLELKKSKISYVLTVENLDSYHNINSTQGLVIFLGGFQNSSKVSFLKKLKMFFSELSFYHFGDIDVGGFEILKSLSAKTDIDFKPFLMDVETLTKYSKFGKKLSANDKSILKRKIAFEYSEIFDFMLKHNLKLEQEIVETKDAIERINV